MTQGFSGVEPAHAAANRGIGLRVAEKHPEARRGFERKTCNQNSEFNSDRAPQVEGQVVKTVVRPWFEVIEPLDA